MRPRRAARSRPPPPWRAGSKASGIWFGSPRATPTSTTGWPPATWRRRSSISAHATGRGAKPGRSARAARARLESSPRRSTARAARPGAQGSGLALFLRAHAVAEALDRRALVVEDVELEPEARDHQSILDPIVDVAETHAPAVIGEVLAGGVEHAERR